MKEFNYASFLELAIDLSVERNLGKLFGRILNEAMTLTGCDAGTLYILEEDKLHFHYMITKSVGVDKCAERGEIDIPPVPIGRQHICAVSALDKKLINIPDVYKSTDYDFSGAKRYDSMTGYHTGSMLVIPMLDDEDKCLGVLQLINVVDGENILPFTLEDEWVIRALSSFAAISLKNRQLTEEIKEILRSFVMVMVDAIDTRSPYNANHTKSMVGYAEKFLRWTEESQADFRIEEKDYEPFLMSVWLHDIGKLLIPLEIMDKATRLGDALKDVMHRITVGILMEKIQGTPEKIKIIEDARDLILDINNSGFLTDEKAELLSGLNDIKIMDENGNDIPLLNSEEMTCLSIKRGTLTDDERRKIEDHVTYTGQMLRGMNFSGRYKDVPKVAGGHHELLDGSGYPDKVKENDIPKETRLLTILDVYDALTAEDRPYKPPMQPDKAFEILGDMAKNGKIDEEILGLFIKSKAWEK